MKLGIRKFVAPFEVTEVFPRSDGPVAFKARAVLDYSAFDALCPLPLPPRIRLPGEGVKLQLDDPQFIKKQMEYIRHKSNWTTLKSLEATEDLVWEKVDSKNPETWHLWQDELRESFFTETEINKIHIAIARANSLDSEFLELAKKDFLALEVRRAQSSSQKDALVNTESGEPVKDSNSVLPASV